MHFRVLELARSIIDRISLETESVWRFLSHFAPANAKVYWLILKSDLATKTQHPGLEMTLAIRRYLNKGVWLPPLGAGQLHLQVHREPQLCSDQIWAPETL